MADLGVPLPYEVLQIYMYKLYIIVIFLFLSLSLSPALSLSLSLTHTHTHSVITQVSRASIPAVVIVFGMVQVTKLSTIVRGRLTQLLKLAVCKHQQTYRGVKNNVCTTGTPYGRGCFLWMRMSKTLLSLLARCKNQIGISLARFRSLPCSLALYPSPYLSLALSG